MVCSVVQDEGEGGCDVQVEDSVVVRFGAVSFGEQLARAYKYFESSCTYTHVPVPVWIAI